MKLQPAGYFRSAGNAVWFRRVINFADQVALAAAPLQDGPELGYRFTHAAGRGEDELRADLLKQRIQVQHTGSIKLTVAIGGYDFGLPQRLGAEYAVDVE